MESWRKLNGEVRPSGRVHEIDSLPEYLFFTSVLAQFKLPQVRDDFTRGKFKLANHCCDLTLSELDRLSSVLIPSLFGFEDRSFKSNISTAQSVLRMIIQRGPGELHLTINHSLSRTYEEWYKCLRSVAYCSYWKENRFEGHKQGTSHRQPGQSSVESNTEPVVTADVGVNTLKLHFADVGTHSELCVGVLDGGSVSVCCSGDEQEKLADENSNLVTAPHCLHVVQCASRSPKETTADGCQSLDKAKVCDSVQTSNVSLSRAVVSCSWCHKFGHWESNCWRKRGLCLICGGHHLMKDCSKYIPPIPLEKPTCSSCGGAHLGKDCAKLSRYRHGCNWCGRLGHLEDQCWGKQRCCLICGSSGHTLVHCPGFVPRSVLPMFPPWCSTCGSHHLGTECESPYIE